MEMAGIASRRGVDKWTVPLKLVPLQTFSVYIMHFSKNLYEDAMLLENCRHITISKWSERRRGCFYSMDIGSPLELDA